MHIYSGGSKGAHHILKNVGGHFELCCPKLGGYGFNNNHKISKYATKYLWETYKKRKPQNAENQLRLNINKNILFDLASSLKY